MLRPELVELGDVPTGPLVGNAELDVTEETEFAIVVDGPSFESTLDDDGKLSVGSGTLWVVRLSTEYVVQSVLRALAAVLLDGFILNNVEEVTYGLPEMVVPKKVGGCEVSFADGPAADEVEGVAMMMPLVGIVVPSTFGVVDGPLLRDGVDPIVSSDDGVAIP